MGAWMAGNAAKAGYTVYGFDIDQAALQNAKNLVLRYFRVKAVGCYRELEDD